MNKRLFLGILVGIFFIGLISAPIWDSSLVSYYPFNESSGTNAEDVLEDYNGTLINGVVVGREGKLGTAYGFDGTNDYVNLSNFDINTELNYSISIWFKTNSTNDKKLITQETQGSATNSVVLVDLATSGIRFCNYNTTNGVTCATATGFSDTTGWHNVVAVWNGTTKLLYLDGALNTTSVLAGTAKNLPYTTTPWQIGGRFNSDTTEYYNGTMDEIGIWNRTLSASEISSIYNSGNGLEYGNEGTDNFPTYSTNSTNSTTAGTTIQHRLYWQDETALSGYIFSFDNGTGAFTNDSWVSMIGTLNWSNVSKIVNFTVGSTIQWKVYANDSSNNLNESITYSYLTTEPSDEISPSINIQSPLNNSYNTNTIWFNATANETISKWIVNYNGTNTTLSAINTTLNVEDGFHQLLLYANDSSNNFGLNNSIYFRVDTVQPEFVSDYSLSETEVPIDISSWVLVNPDMIQVDGVLYVVYADAEPCPGHIYLKNSTDNGATWSSAYNLSQAADKCATDPFITHLSNGKWLLSYLNQTSVGANRNVLIRSADTWADLLTATTTPIFSYCNGVSFQCEGNTNILEVAGNELLYILRINDTANGAAVNNIDKVQLINASISAPTTWTNKSWITQTPYVNTAHWYIANTTANSDNLIVGFYNDSGAYEDLKIMNSSDGGETWGNVYEFMSNINPGRPAFGTLSNGDLMMFVANRNNYTHTAYFSNGNGTDGSWYTSITVKDYSNNVGYGTWQEIQNGLIFLAYSTPPKTGTDYDINGTWISFNPTNFSYYTNESVNIQINATDDIAISSYTINWSSDFTIGFLNGIITNTTALSAGIKVINITINDTSNNVNSMLFYITINDYPAGGDTTPPTFTTIPDNATITYGTLWNGVDFEATDETSFDSYSVNDSRFTINSTGYLNSTSLLAAMVYVLNITINDSSGNQNYTFYNLTINKAVPTGTLSSSAGWAIINGTETTISLSESNSGDGDLTYVVYRNGTNVGTGETWTPEAGTYNYTLNTTGGVNYSSNASIYTRNLTVSTAQNITITIIYPTSIIDYGQPSSNLSLNYTITGANDTCWVDYNFTNQTINCTASSPLTLYSNTTEIQGGVNPGYEFMYVAYNASDEFIDYVSSEITATGDTIYTLISAIEYVYSDATRVNVSNNVPAHNTTFFGANFTNPSPTKRVDYLNLYLYGVGGEQVKWKNFNVYKENSILIENSIFNMTIYANDTLGNINSSYINWSYKVFANLIDYNTTTYETMQETFIINVTANSSLTSVKLVYNGTEYPATQSGSSYSKTLSIPTVSSQTTLPFYWKFTYAGDTINSSSSNQTVNPIIFTLCNSTYTNDFLNISFKDEASSTDINASITSSTFVYYLGNGTVNKTYSFSNSTNNMNYSFCASPTDKTFHVDPYVQYKQGTDYPQKTWDPLIINYTATVTNQVLYLLSSTEGIYVTFQVVNAADQVLSGVSSNITLAGSLVGSGTTGADGLVTYWLNPDSTYTAMFYLSPYSTYSTTQQFTQTSYTISLGSVATDSGTTGSSSHQGVNYTIQPSPASYLSSNTSYVFNFSVDSSYWSLDSYGFNITNSTGFSFGEVSDTTSGGGKVSLTLNTSSNQSFTMNYYWVIDSVTTRASVTWLIVDTSGNTFSISHLVDNFATYKDSGLFGLTDFGVGLICFFIIIGITGVLKMKTGVSNTAAVLGVMWALTALLDVSFNLLPNPINAVPHFATILLGLVFIGELIREGFR